MMYTLCQKRKMPLTEEQIRIIEATAPVVASHSLDITRAFYPHMFAENPEVFEFFNRANPIATAAPQPTGIPIDLTPAREPAVEVIHAFNAWPANDLDIPPAAVTHCAEQSLPQNPRDLMHLLPDAHKTFFEKVAGPTYETLQLTPAQTTNSFDPTADMLPVPSETPEGQHAQATAKSYFHTHPVEVIQATGTDTDLTITLQIALAPQASLLFSFITGLSD